VNYQNAQDQFIQTIRGAGMSPPDVIEPGQMVRFSDNGGRNRNGWAIFYTNPDGSAGGAFGNWKDVNRRWFSGNGQEPTPEQRERLRQQIEQAKQRAEAARKVVQDRASQRAQKILNIARSANLDHPYLKAKKVGAYRIKQSGKTLVVPILDETKSVVSLQFISPDGSKLLLKGGRKKGCFIVLGVLRGATTAYLAEGYATAATIHEATGQAVIVAFDAGNLEPVCETIRGLYPNIELTICADNDLHTEGNPGRTRAEAAALAYGLRVTIPDRAGDFNDLVSRDGLPLDEIKK
jgi:putative DNA primase/helicase